MLRASEAGELLVPATVTGGETILTPLGEAMVEVSIIGCKEIAATRAHRLPMMRWVVSRLKAADTHSLNADMVETVLELQFPAEESRRQLSTVVDLGRYVQLFAYIDGKQAFSLEPFSDGEAVDYRLPSP